MKRGAVVAVVGAAAVVAAGVGVAVWALDRPPTPEAVAESYLRALSEGDFAGIEAVMREPLEQTERDPLEAAFAGASGYITDYDFSVTDDGSGTKGVRADVEIAGAPGVVFFGLQSDGGEWKVADDMLGSLAVTTTLGDSVLVGGLLAFAGPPIPLLPAVYPIAASPAGVLTGSTEAVVTNEEPVRATLEAALTAEATALAQTQLDAYAEACAAAATAVPDDCGLKIPWAADFASLDGIRFRIEQLPAVALGADARTFAATGGVIVATATGTARDGSAASVTYRADDWALRGTLRFTRDQMALLVG